MTYLPLVELDKVTQCPPTYFLLCIEGFSSMLKFLGPNFLAKGVRVDIHAPWVSHLLFTDDCMVFMQASEQGGAC
jgi:hypothetical protein